MLEIRNFSKSYEKGKRAVDNLSLTVKDGEIYGFIGHNGARKIHNAQSGGRRARVRGGGNRDRRDLREKGSRRRPKDHRVYPG